MAARTDGELNNKAETGTNSCAAFAGQPLLRNTGNDHILLLVPRLDIGVRRGDIIERIDPINDRSKGARVVKSSTV
jgi:hypothetical protein